MSQTAARIVEWSPNGIRVFDRATGRARTFPNAAAAAAEIGSGPIVLAVSRRSSFYRTLPLPNASRSDLRRLLEVQAANVFPLPLAELAYDFQTTEEVGPEGRTTQLVAMAGDELRGAIQEMERAGLSVQRVVPTAAGSALLAGSAGVPDAVIVEATPEGLAFDAVSGGILRATRVAMSDASLEEEARRTAAIVGLSEPIILLAPNIPEATSANGVTANGSAKAALPRLTETPLAALVGDRAQHVSFDLEPREIQAERESKERSRRTRLAALLALAALSLASLVYFDRADAQAAVDKERAKMNASLNRLRAVQKAVESDVLREATNLRALDQAFAPAQPLAEVVTLIANQAPQDLWLTGITADRGKSVLVRGTATRSEAVAAFLDRLAKTGRFRDVRLVFSNNANIDEAPVVQFSISAFPIGNLPLAEKSIRR